MNLWECDYRYPNGSRCKSTAIGCGGAIGLRAIGWHFAPGRIVPDDGTLEGVIESVFASLSRANSSRLYCPAHRPDPVAENERRPDCKRARSPSEGPCSMCKGEIEADEWQTMILAETAPEGAE
jgi:hypothetical protein